MTDDRVDIKLSKQQRKQLKELKVYSRESYGDTIQRIHEERFCENNPKSGKCKKIKKRREN